MIKELHADQNEVLIYLAQKGQSHFKREVLNASKYPYFPTPITYTTSKGHKYLVIAVARKRSDWKKLDFYMQRIHNNKIYGIDSFEGVVTVYPTHILERYRERYLKDKTIPMLDVIKIFFKRNPFFEYKRRTDGTYMATCKDGVVFGIVKDGYRIVKTFVTYDMLFENQTKLSVFLETLREKRWETIA